MIDQVVIKQRILVQRVSQGLMAVPVIQMENGDLIYNLVDRVLIVPGRPLEEITPLDAEGFALAQ
jgi:hypothetical protein